MTEYVEVSPLPDRCLVCEEKECYNCDYLLDRWHPVENEEEE